jgi:hypothetical protein
MISDEAILISALDAAPGVILPLIREVPPQIIKRRPSPAKWSAYEHAIHLSQTDAPFRARLELILSSPERTSSRRNLHLRSKQARRS